jgi:hypothetical protein
VTRIGLDEEGTGMEKRRAQWSEREGSVESMDVMEVESERVMSKSRVWLREWVGNEICWVREKESRRWRKETAEEQMGSSTWILKSPVMKSSDGEVARSESRIEKSERKALMEEDGGR